MIFVLWCSCLAQVGRKYLTLWSLWTLMNKVILLVKVCVGQISTQFYLQYLPWTLQYINVVSRLGDCKVHVSRWVGQLVQKGTCRAR